MNNAVSSRESTAAPFSWEDVWQAGPTTIHEGQWANSTVLRVQLADAAWAIKTYRDKSWIYRHTFGRHWSNREYRSISTLKGLPGIPRDPCLLDPWTFCSRYEEGRTLIDMEESHASMSKEFFLAWESTVQSMHQRGICHLDMRNGRNVLVLQDGSPLLLDFQSCIRLKHLPPALRGIPTHADLSGVYKWWNRLSPETMDEARFERMLTLNRRRTLWPFKGYGSWIRLYRSKPIYPPGKPKR